MNLDINSISITQGNSTDKQCEELSFRFRIKTFIKSNYAIRLTYLDK